MMLEKHPEIQHLSTDDKFILAGEIWDDLAAQVSTTPVDDVILAELDRRAEEYRKNPEAVVRWEDAKARILGSRSK